MNTTFAFSFDMSNNAHVQAFGAMMALAASASVTFSPVGAVAPQGKAQVAQVSAPVAQKPQTTAEKPQDVQVPLEWGKGARGEVLVKCGYPAQCSKNAHAVANGILRNAGFQWDDDRKFYVGTADMRKKAGLKANDTTVAVTAQQIQERIDRNERRAERRASR